MPLTVTRSATLAALAALCLFCTGVHAQTAAPHGHPTSKGAPDMKAAMMSGTHDMQQMPTTGDTDKDFALLMKLHHEQALPMAELQLAHGKSPELKALARQIIAAQKREIAQFDRWLARHQ